MKYSAFQCENVNGVHVAFTFTTDIQIVPLSIDTRPEMSLPFICRLMNNCLVNATPDRSQMLLHFFSNVSS